MSGVLSVRVSDEAVERVDNLVKKRKTTRQEWLQAVVMGELDKVEKHWFNIGLPWGKRPYDAREQVFTVK